MDIRAKISDPVAGRIYFDILGRNVVKFVDRVGDEGRRVWFVSTDRGVVYALPSWNLYSATDKEISLYRTNHRHYEEQ